MNYYQKMIEETVIPQILEQKKQTGEFLCLSRFVFGQHKQRDFLLESGEDIGYLDSVFPKSTTISAQELSIKMTARKHYPIAVITADVVRKSPKEKAVDFFDMYKEKIEVEDNLVNEIIFSVENYEENSRFIYEVEKEDILYKNDLPPLQRKYLPYFN